jgi:hypothetical protein
MAVEGIEVSKIGNAVVVESAVDEFMVRFSFRRLLFRRILRFHKIRIDRKRQASADRTPRL